MSQPHVVTTSRTHRLVYAQVNNFVVYLWILEICSYSVYFTAKMRKMVIFWRNETQKTSKRF